MFRLKAAGAGSQLARFMGGGSGGRPLHSKQSQPSGCGPPTWIGSLPISDLQLDPNALELVANGVLHVLDGNEGPARARRSSAERPPRNALDDARPASHGRRRGLLATTAAAFASARALAFSLLAMRLASTTGSLPCSSQRSTSLPRIVIAVSVATLTRTPRSGSRGASPSSRRLPRGARNRLRAPRRRWRACRPRCRWPPATRARLRRRR